MSSPVFYNGTVVAVMRFVTSTRLLDQQLWLTVLVMAAAGRTTQALTARNNKEEADHD